MIPATFRRFERMSLREDFSRARSSGRRRAGRHLVIWGRFRGETPPRASRLGLVVGRRHGPAVHRNLFKRRVREAFRLHKDRWPRGWDFVVSPRTSPPGAFPAPFQALEGDFLNIVRSIVG